ncbi:hypothetical protein ES711_02980 [Gelidibacter salicanalis]|uniref:Uncharacterized protein n=1 Tax=Gelidibacter salicanalis TaxID=291193 RepID=A0A5C7AYW3_9FLAO|nr:hypothetical protein [Gelidibacter salicanalis]TXE10882.1 hypothetical protein ES711_02980 [Gelidibacter salicanalis]
MKADRQYRIDLWIFIGSVIVLLYLLLINVMFDNAYSNTNFKDTMEMITIFIFSVGAFIPLIVIFRGISKKTESKSLAILTMLFSLLTAFLIGYTTLL